MILQELEKLTSELKALQERLKQAKNSHSRNRIHKRAFKIIRQIEGGRDQ